MIAAALLPTLNFPYAWLAYRNTCEKLRSTTCRGTQRHSSNSLICTLCGVSWASSCSCCSNAKMRCCTLPPKLLRLLSNKLHFRLSVIFPLLLLPPTLWRVAISSQALCQCAKAVQGFVTPGRYWIVCQIPTTMHVCLSAQAHRDSIDLKDVAVHTPDGHRLLCDRWETRTHVISLFS